MLVGRELLHTPGKQLGTSEYFWAGISVWELRIKNVLNAFGSIQLSR